MLFAFPAMFYSLKNEKAPAAYHKREENRESSAADAVVLFAKLRRWSWLLYWGSPLILTLVFARPVPDRFQGVKRIYRTGCASLQCTTHAKDARK
jgi:hypothetical protein